MPLSQAERERVIQTLSAHYASDHISTEDLEARIERVYRATSTAELAVVLLHLPPLRDADVTPTKAMRALPARADEVRDERKTMSLMSETVKKGSWIPARRNVHRAVMSAVTFDLREAVLGPGETEFDLTAIMAEIQVIVPPGLTVSCDGHAFMGEFNEHNFSGGDGVGVSSVRITGTAIMATVSVSMRLPGESARDAKRRLKAEGRRP